MIEIIFVLLVVSIYVYFRFLKRKKSSAAEMKGLLGEQKVNDILKKEKLIYFHDTLLKKGSVSSQFDHIVIFPNKTILVIETKNKDGFISGKANDEQWLQVIGKNRYSFYNPVKQNEGHIKMIYKKMNDYRLFGYKVLSLVIFTSDRSTLKNLPSNVIHINDLPSTLKILKKKTLFNHSRKFTRMLMKEDFSKNRREVQKHKDFAIRARNFKK